MKFYRLTHENFLMYAIKKYENPDCNSSDKFKKDMKIFVYITKFLNKMHTSDAPNYRLMLNHIVTLVNLFGAEPTARMLFFYVPAKHHGVVKAALGYLHVLPVRIPEADLTRVVDDPTFSAFLETI